MVPSGYFMYEVFMVFSGYFIYEVFMVPSGYFMYKVFMVPNVNFLKEFFCPQDMIKSQNYFYCESLVLSGFILINIDLPGVVIWRHIHPSTLHSYWEDRGLTRFQLPKGFLGLRIIKCRNSSDMLVCGQGALLIGNIPRIAH